MEEETDKGIKTVMADAAAETSECENARLAKENEELKERIESLVRERDQYRDWWREGNVEKDRLRDIVRSLAVYANFA